MYHDGIKIQHKKERFINSGVFIHIKWFLFYVYKLTEILYLKLTLKKNLLNKSCCYCPDCGKYIENRWYLTRCSCCNVKRKTIIKFDNIMPETKYCPNCGSEHYRVEEVKSINFIDINFAVLVKQINEERSLNRTQTWLERENSEPVKLLGFNLNFGQ